jgi:hypothetical protein
VRVPRIGPIARPFPRVTVCHGDVEMLAIRREWQPRDRLRVRHEHFPVQKNRVDDVLRGIDPLESV